MSVRKRRAPFNSHEDGPPHKKRLVHLEDTHALHITETISKKLHLSIDNVQLRAWSTFRRHQRGNHYGNRNVCAATLLEHTQEVDDFVIRVEAGFQDLENTSCEEDDSHLSMFVEVRSGFKTYAAHLCPFFDAKLSCLNQSRSMVHHLVGSGTWGWNKFIATSRVLKETKPVTFTFEIRIMKPTKTLEHGSLPAKTETMLTPNETKSALILKSLYDSRKHCDVVILCDDHTQIPCHKSILSAASPVFDKMFDSTFAESNDGKIQIRDFSMNVINMLVRYLYCGSESLPAGGAFVEWHKLFEIAEKYDINDLCRLCVRYMINVAKHVNVSPENEDSDIEILRIQRFGGSGEHHRSAMDSDDENDGGVVPLDEDDEDDGLEQKFNESLSVDGAERVDPSVLGRRETDVLFHLLNLFVQYEHVAWLGEIERGIFATNIVPKLRALFKQKDSRFDGLPSAHLLKFCSYAV